LLAHGRWFSLGTPASSTTKTGRHDIAEILLKVALNTDVDEIEDDYYADEDIDASMPEADQGMAMGRSKDSDRLENEANKNHVCGTIHLEFSHGSLCLIKLNLGLGVRVREIL
jgi:hypothetical protein